MPLPAVMPVPYPGPSTAQRAEEAEVRWESLSIDGLCRVRRIAHAQLVRLPATTRLYVKGSSDWTFDPNTDTWQA